MLKSSLCDYNDAHMLVKGTVTVAYTSATGSVTNKTNKKEIFKNCAPCTNCISQINNAPVDYAKDIDIIMPMYNLIEYIDNYSKASGSLQQNCKDITAVNNNGNIEANATDSFNCKAKITGQTDDDGEKDNVEIMVLLKYLSNFFG